jgi:hypothetical protein
MVLSCWETLLDELETVSQGPKTVFVFSRTEIPTADLETEYSVLHLGTVLEGREIMFSLLEVAMHGLETVIFELKMVLPDPKIMSHVLPTLLSLLVMVSIDSKMS